MQNLYVVHGKKFNLQTGTFDLQIGRTNLQIGILSAYGFDALRTF